MAATQPTLGGTTLPHPKNPDGFEMEREYRGGMRLASDGTPIIDLVQASAKHKFVLHWSNISNTDWQTLLTAFATVANSSATLVAPDGTSYTVTRDPGTPGLRGTMQTVGGSAQRWTASMFLREA